MHELRSGGAEARYVHLDVSNEASWDGAVATTVRESGRLDILVNNAGIGDNDALEATSMETYARIVAVTQTSVFLGMKATAEALKASGSGSVVNVSSIFGVVGGFGTSPAYAAAKGAVRNLTKDVALLWATQGVRVTPSILVHRDADPRRDRPTAPRRRDPARAPGPPDRGGRGHRVPRAAASFVTGAELYVDGGYLAR